MSKYTGPRLKIMRRLGVQLPGLSRKNHERRPYPPGEHGQSRRPKLSEYGIRLKEKQKIRMNYGLSERQLRRYFKKASASKGKTGAILLSLIESRLDNIVFRAGLAPTIPAARQLVNHGHIRVNGRKANIASIHIRPGDAIQVREKSRKMASIITSLEQPSLMIPDFLSVDAAQMSVMLNRSPESADVPFDLQINLVVEHYARLVG